MYICSMYFVGLHNKFFFFTRQIIASETILPHNSSFVIRKPVVFAVFGKRQHY
jgi:hypothetical protein